MIHTTSLTRLREVGYKPPKGTKPVELTCGHTAFYLPPLPVPGSDAFCRECDAWRRRKRASRRRSPGGRPATVRPPLHMPRREPG